MKQNQLFTQVLNDPKYADHRKEILKGFLPLNQDSVFPVIYFSPLEECLPASPEPNDSYLVQELDSEKQDHYEQELGLNYVPTYTFLIPNRQALYQLIARLCQGIAQHAEHNLYNPGDDSTTDIHCALDAIHDLKEFESLMLFHY